MSLDHLPHRAPYRFVSAVEHADGRSARVLATAPEGTAPEVSARLVEVAAQAAAVAHGAEAGEAREGVLMGVRRFRVHQAPLAGAPLRVEAVLRGALGGQALFRCQVRALDGTLLAEGDLALAAS